MECFIPVGEDEVAVGGEAAGTVDGREVAGKVDGTVDGMEGVAAAGGVDDGDVPERYLNRIKD